MTRRRKSLVFPAMVRGQVFEQHETLRTLLQRALDDTTLALRGQEEARSRLAKSTRELATRFRAHLAFEERHLVPILAIVDLWGPERVSALLDEHARQRSELDTLLEVMHEAWEPEPLAVTLRSLATDLLRDMEEEESGLRSELLDVDHVLTAHAP